MCGVLQLLFLDSNMTMQQIPDTKPPLILIVNVQMDELKVEIPASTPKHDEQKYLHEP